MDFLLFQSFRSLDLHSIKAKGILVTKEQVSSNLVYLSSTLTNLRLIQIHDHRRN